MLQAYCKLIVALLAAVCVHGFHADMHTWAPQPSLARGPRRATGPRTTMICVQRRHSETEHLRPIPGRRDVRHSDSPFGARPLHWARNRWAHDEPNANAKRGPPPFEL